MRTGSPGEDLRFSRRDVGTATGRDDTQLKVHRARLVELECLLLHRGSRGQSFVYEVLYRGEGRDGSRFLPGLLDVTTLDECDGERLGGGRGAVAVKKTSPTPLPVRT